MNYIDEIAREIYHVDDPDSEPSEQDMALYRIYAVLALVKGTGTTAEDVHDAWSAWQAGINPEHRSLIPFNELEWRVQRLDDPYVEAIHTVAGRIERETFTKAS